MISLCIKVNYSIEKFKVLFFLEIQLYRKNIKYYSINRT